MRWSSRKCSKRIQVSMDNRRSWKEYCVCGHQDCKIFAFLNLCWRHWMGINGVQSFPQLKCEQWAPVWWIFFFLFRVGISVRGSRAEGTGSSVPGAQGRCAGLWLYVATASVVAFEHSCRYFSGEGEKELNWIKLNCILIATIIQKSFHMWKTS